MQEDPFQTDRDQLRRQIGRLRRRLDGRVRTAVGLPAWLLGRSKKPRPAWSLGLVLAAVVGWFFAREKLHQKESSE